MRVRFWSVSGILALVTALAGTSVTHAQAADSTHRFALFANLATGPGTTGGVQNNGGIGASLDVVARGPFVVRGLLSYNRVGLYDGGAPNQIGSLSLDGVVHLAPSTWRIRPYAMLGVGFSAAARRSYFYDIPGVGLTSSTTARRWWYGPEGGLGLRLGRAFVEYRIPPISFSHSASSIDYAPVSVGFRF
jgi:hypothetical protein